jgi:hypothetical protein
LKSKSKSSKGKSKESPVTTHHYVPTGNDNGNDDGKSKVQGQGRLGQGR